MDKSDSCKKGYFLRNNNCFSCDQECQTCQHESLCQIYSSDYVSIGDFSCTKCLGRTDCTILLEIVLCNKFATGTYLSSNGSSIPCVQNCTSCDSNGICQCCDDPTKYFQTFDGYNCQPCSILKCIYCYQYFVKNGITYQVKLEVNTFELKIKAFYVIKLVKQTERQMTYIKKFNLILMMQRPILIQVKFYLNMKHFNYQK
ncbi:unnamed protein product [Paramecium primaurelia]|uniref:Uncharacterized protein n=1 Tax=Paramecium primaurelia TaxID=5886 RepID=A0A8S1L263_PARPR|nr:unnamed protein product [Paramecium primaurelia]CAD8059484.1 unnamed protein product [Paramecium primaurelia]